MWDGDGSEGEEQVERIPQAAGGGRVHPRQRPNRTHGGHGRGLRGRRIELHLLLATRLLLVAHVVDPHGGGEREGHEVGAGDAPHNPRALRGWRVDSSRVSRAFSESA